MSNLFDRAGMSTATTGGGSLTLGSALGAVAPNLAGFLSFANAGVADQNIVSYLILDASGAWETGWGVYTASGTTLTRNVTRSSNSNAAINLSGNAQVFITARAEDLATVEALATANIAINGAMEVSQFNGANAVTLTSAAAPGGNSYVVDGFEALYNNSGAVFTAQQSTVNAGSAQGLSLTSCLVIKATTAVSSVGTTDYLTIVTPIEGYRWSRLGFGASLGSAVTVGFWVSTTVTGTFCFSIRNGALSRSYVVNVAIAAANTWQWVAIVVPPDTAGTWNATNGVGAYLTWTFMSGTNQQGTANTWLAANDVATSSISNFFASNNNLVTITGVVVLPGAHQISQEQAAALVRPFNTEIVLCQRYYEKSYDYATLPGAISDNGEVIFRLSGLPSATYTANVDGRFKVRKRSVPAVTIYSPATGASGKARDFAGAADITPSAATIGETGFYAPAAASAAGTSVIIGAHWAADARM